MNHNFGPSEDENWEEFNNSNTPWERKAEILIDLARGAGMKGDFKKERTYLESSLEIAKTHQLEKIQRRANGIMANRAAKYWADTDLALALVDEVLTQHPGFVADDDLMEHLNTLRCAKASALMVLKRWAEAAYEYKVVLEVAQMLQDEYEIAHANYCLSQIYTELDELDKAIEHGLAAKQIYKDNYQMVYQCNTDRQLAKISILSGNFARAKMELREIRAIEQRMFGSSHPETKLFLGMALMGLGQFEKAEKLFGKLFEQNTKPWNFAFDYSIEVGELYAESLMAQGKITEGNRVLFLLKAIEKKKPDSKDIEVELRQEEIKLLSEAGRFDEAELVSRNLLEEVSNAGDVRAHYVAVKALIDTLWKKKDFAGVVAAWDELSPEALNYHDDLVIPVKNFVTHALLRVGRIQEAEQLNIDVRNDFRLAQDPKQMNYANENAARIYKALKQYAKSNQFKERSLQGYIELGDNERALEVMRYFGKGNKQ